MNRECCDCQLAKIIAELEFAVSRLRAASDLASAPIEDRVQWAYRRGARDAYLKVIEALQEAQR
jgi:hypothetical protein